MELHLTLQEQERGCFFSIQVSKRSCESLLYERAEDESDASLKACQPFQRNEFLRCEGRLRNR